MTRPKAFVTRRIAQEALDMIADATYMELWEDDLPTPHEILLNNVRATDGLLTMLTDKIDAELMTAAPKLKVISNMAVGYDNVDVAEATRRGIFVGNTPDVLTETTADFAFALLMATARRVVEADGYVREGKWKTWSPMVLLGQDIHHATLGIVGCGRIGLEVAKRARGFDMKVLYHNRVRRKQQEDEALGLEYVADLSELLSRSDFVTIHAPLTAETHHLIGADELARMKPTAILINTARGGIIDQAALYRALKSGQILAAGLDVAEIEPILPSDPILTLDNVTIAPHIASASTATRTKMATMAAENLLAGLLDKLPPHCVNPEAMKHHTR